MDDARFHPLTGGCNCVTVRFEVTAPLAAASNCHCRRCQRRTGTGVRLQYRQFVASAAPWEPIPEDGLPRYPEWAPKLAGPRASG